MVAVYFTRRESGAQVGSSSCDRNPNCRISIQDIDRAFPDCAERFELPPPQSKEALNDYLEGFQDKAFNAVVVQIRKDEANGQFSTEGHWLLKDITVDQFVAAFSECFPNSISSEEMDQSREEAIAKIRVKRGQDRLT